VSDAEFADALTSVMSSGGRSFSSLLKQIEPDRHRETVTDDWDIETFAIVSWVSICWCDRMKVNAGPACSNWLLDPTNVHTARKDYGSSAVLAHHSKHIEDFIAIWAPPFM
jgi:hypothetical protein